ncbi:MAG TPA: redoxin domain-containing protein [Anaerolineales bacterium]|nr:redoxin domain-containing protein [Anaerolineales bacterium]
MKKKPNWLLIAGLSLAGLCLIGCLAAVVISLFFPSFFQAYLENSSLAIGEAAPDFELTALTGETIRLSQFRGQPVLLSIGATWCPDCRKEAPLLQELHKTHPELVILMVDSKEGPDIVQQFADEFGITHPILLDRDGAVMELYQVFAIPTDLFIDAEGIIRAKIIESVTSQLLAEKLPLIGVEP